MSFESGAGGRLRLVTDVLRSFADATTSYESLLVTIVERVGRLVGQACSIRLLTDDGQTLETAALFDPLNDPRFAQFARVPIPVTPSLRAALDQQRAYVEEIASQKGIDEVHPGARAPIVTRVLVAPLVARGAALGCLFVVQRQPNSDAFSEDDVELVDALARHAALALANSRLLTSLDVVERSRAQKRSILDTVIVPLVLIDRDGGVVSVNRAFTQMFGVDEGKVVGESVLELANRAFDVSGMRELFQELPPSGHAREAVEAKLMTPTGERTFLVRAAKTFQPANGSETTLLTLIDLSDRILAAQLAYRQDLLIQSMNEALIGLDPDFKIEAWNPAAERLFGWTFEEARGKLTTELFSATSYDEDRDETRRRLRAGQTVRARIRIRNRAGDWLDLEFSTMPVVEHGVVRGFVCVMLDATERVRLESQLRARVEELTASNKELESFSYSVSHDLRAPIRAIDGFSEILEREHASNLDAEGLRLLGLVRKNAKRMGLLIDDLLALAKFSRQPIVEEEVDMDTLARATIDDAMRAEPGRTIAVTVHPLPPVRGDESLLRQVWFNLFSNAVKYTRGKEQAAIEVLVREENGKVLFTVKDNGAGFDMRHAAKLFGTFERLHTAKEFEGTGIGLALVARIIDRHGGQVWGTGEVGQGATFVFSLPKASKEIR